MLSVIPPEIGAQAVSVAVRCASSAVVPDALAQFVLPLYVMQTSQLYCASPRVEYTTSAITARNNPIETIVTFDMNFAPF